MNSRTQATVALAVLTIVVAGGISLAGLGDESQNSPPSDTTVTPTETATAVSTPEKTETPSDTETPQPTVTPTPSSTPDSTETPTSTPRESHGDSGGKGDDPSVNVGVTYNVTVE